jgi:hypothetical protein
MIRSKKLELFYFFVLLTISFTSSFFLKNNLENDQALGTHTFLFFVPWFLYLIFHSIYNIEFKIYKYLLFIFISFIPVINYLDREIFHLIGDDSNVYSIHAKYMINNLTLNGNVLGKSFEDQPGFPYFLAIEILLFGKQTRGMQLFNIFMFFTFYLFFIKQFISNFKDKKIILLIFILCLPYTIKNILFCYNEWLCVLFLILIYVAINNKKYYVAVVILSLLPFIRQNLLIISLILFFILMFNITKISSNKNKLVGYIIIYISILFLPIYHNYIYAGEFRFFVTSRPFNSHIFKNLGDIINPLVYINNFDEMLNLYKKFFEKIILTDGRKNLNIIISLFVPCMAIYFIYLLVIEKNNTIKFLLIFCSILVFYPTIFLGHLAPPRFEYVNLFSIYILYSIIKTTKLKFNGK